MATRIRSRGAWNDEHSVRFDSLSELDDWFAEQRRPLLDKMRVPRERLTQYTRTRSSTGKTDMKVLVCHDFMGGYNKEEDDSPAGYFPHALGEHYFLQFPSLVDTFIYFSHHRVTVPPVSWINMLHTQGIPCLGTIILEGTDNRDLDRIVERDSTGAFVYVEKLVALAQHYGFDGWLINVETTFTRPSSAMNVVLFTEMLRSEMHKRVKWSQVIWYDAFIASKNRVFYQNGVNELNYDHFDSSDSFFTNYWWDENALKKNVLNIGLQGTKKKLFVGIDVWGRGAKVGKGGFDTGLAINFLRVYSSNVALFAPAWTYENFERDHFIDNDAKFWIGEMSDSYPSGSVASYIRHSTAPVFTRPDGDITFYTNFSQGQGDMFKVMGKTVYSEHWVSKSLQMPTPADLDGKTLSITKQDAFNGGSSLKIVHKGRSVPSSISEKGIELFEFQTDVDSKHLNISISFKQISAHVPEHFFQLEIKYYVERRFRSITRVKDGKFILPLHASHNWKYLETSLSLPRLHEREHFVLSGATVHWTNSTDAVMRDVEQSWIMVQSCEKDPNVKHELLIGDLLIESSDDMVKRQVGSVKKVRKTRMDDDQVFLEWKDEDEVLMWLVYENAKFQRPFVTPCYVANMMDKVRVDCLTRSGKLITGMDIFV